MVFPAQSGCKLWPSLCALGTRPTAIPILSLAFPTQSRPRALAACPSSSPKHHSPFLTGHQPPKTSCSRYSEIWERSGNLKRLNYCTCDPERHGNYSSGGNEAAGAPLQTFLHVTARGVGGGKPFVFLFSSSQSSKTAERRLTCFLMKRFLSYQQCSWFLSPLSGLIRRLQRRGPLLLYDWETHL